MATWAKVKFCYISIPEQTAVTATATSTESTGDYDVDYVANSLEGKSWQAEDSGMASTQTLVWDGNGSTFDADYFAVIGHNFNTAGVTIALEYSATGSWGGEETDAFTPYAPTDDLVQFKEFSAPGVKEFWRLKITSATGDAPYAAVIKFGLKTELDYASTEFDPHQQRHMTNVNISQGGFVTGIHQRYIERKLSLSFTHADSTLYGKVKSWIDDNALKNFFVAWETANNSTEVWLMRSDASFNNPLVVGGAYRNININLIGRKE